MPKPWFKGLLCWASILTVAVLIVSPSAFHAAPQAGGYKVIRTILLGGDGGWDYVTVDPELKRVYIPRSNDVMVVDEVTGKITDMTTPGMAGLHEAKWASDLNVGMITGNEGTPPHPVIYLFDVKALKITDTLTPEGNLKGNDGGEYDPFNKRFFSYTAMSNNMVVVDAATKQIVGVKNLLGRPEASMADDKGNMWVQVSDHSLIEVFDTKTLNTTHVYFSAPCDRGSSLAMDKAHHRLFLGCRAIHEVAGITLPAPVDKDMFVVMNMDNGQVIQSLPLTGTGVDGAGFDPATGDIFFSNRDRLNTDLKTTTFDIFHQDSPDKYSKVGSLDLLYGARTMGYDPKTHRAFLVTTAENTPGTPTPTAPNPAPRPVQNTFTLIEVGK
jgi:hypothetical protein